MNDRNSRSVYSTDKNIPGKDTSRVHSTLSDSKPVHQKVIVRLERKGRRGKNVTIVHGLRMNRKSSISFFKHLKTKLGTGGTAKEDRFEFQGDHCNRLIDELEKKGFKPKRSGR